jgi:hypothetical protein
VSPVLEFVPLLIQDLFLFDFCCRPKPLQFPLAESLARAAVLGRGFCVRLRSFFVEAPAQGFSFPASSRAGSVLSSDFCARRRLRFSLFCPRAFSSSFPVLPRAEGRHRWLCSLFSFRSCRRSQLPAPHLLTARFGFAVPVPAAFFAAQAPGARFSFPPEERRSKFRSPGRALD